MPSTRIFSQSIPRAAASDGRRKKSNGRVVEGLEDNRMMQVKCRWLKGQGSSGSHTL